MVNKCRLKKILNRNILVINLLGIAHVLCNNFFYYATG